MSNPTTSLPPGFRFHPTDEELIFHYLRNRAAAIPCPVSIIAEVDIYKFDPWDLPAMAMFGDKEWYFFTPRDRKYPNGIRPNRAAASGYWKATGTDKPIHTSSRNENIGVKKALVFYQGRPPKGLKTSWIMHEYRLAESHSNTYKPTKLRDSSMRLDDWVLCRIYKRSNHVSSVAALIYHEPEDSGSEDMYFSSTVPNVMTMQPQNSNNTVGLHKSSSLNEFLNLLFDNPSEVLGTDQNGGHGQLMSYSNSSNENNSLVYQEISHGVDENSLKRSRQDESNEESSGTSKRPMIETPYHQIESLQFGFLTQPFLNQQILLNSNLGLHSS